MMPPAAAIAVLFPAGQARSSDVTSTSAHHDHPLRRHEHASAPTLCHNTTSPRNLRTNVAGSQPPKGRTPGCLHARVLCVIRHCSHDSHDASSPGDRGLVLCQIVSPKLVAQCQHHTCHAHSPTATPRKAGKPHTGSLATYRQSRLQGLPGHRIQLPARLSRSDDAPAPPAREEWLQRLRSPSWSLLVSRTRQ